jgi:hypothetical protein
MNTEITKINIDSCWFDADEREEYIKNIKEKYNLECEFHDGSDYYSSWTYTGTKENIKKFLDVEYIPYVEEEEYCDDVIDFLHQ